MQWLDYLSAIFLTACIMTIEHWKFMWIPYSIANVLFCVVTASKGLWGMTIMGIVLAISGLNNYRLSRRKI